MSRLHWFGEDVHTIDTTLDELPALLPVFERYAFGRNRFHDVIARRPAAADHDGALPVGLVSKSYVLVQHADAVRAVTAEVTKAAIDPGMVPAHLEITEYGTRMALRVTLPPEHAFVPDDGHEMALTFECFNSVDGTVPLFALVGWFRFVCTNGLVVRTATARVQQKHIPPLDPEDISGVLAEGMEIALYDARSFAKWRSRAISTSDLAAWVDGAVARAWGPRAASRVFAISTTGMDGTPVPYGRNPRPHEWTLRDGRSVPGSERPARNAYAVAQALAWVAAQRGHVAKRLDWRAQIRPLMSQLLPASA